MQKGEFSYPLLLIENPGDELALLLEGLEAGTLPVVLLYGGRIVEVSKIKKDPYQISKLLRIYKLVIFQSPEKKSIVTTNEELLDLEGFRWMD